VGNTATATITFTVKLATEEAPVAIVAVMASLVLMQQGVSPLVYGVVGGGCHSDCRGYRRGSGVEKTNVTAFPLQTDGTHSFTIYMDATPVVSSSSFSLKSEAKSNSSNKSFTAN